MKFLAGFNFAIAFINIYLGILNNNPESFLAAGLCFTAGVLATITD